jgi:hypothetical protein
VNYFMLDLRKARSDEPYFPRERRCTSHPPPNAKGSPMSNKILLCAALGFCSLLALPARSSAEPACGPFIAALKGAAPGKKMDKGGEDMFTKVCKRNSEQVVKTATACLEKGKGGGDATLGPCLQPLK